MPMTQRRRRFLPRLRATLIASAAALASMLVTLSAPVPASAVDQVTRTDNFERANGSLGADWVSDRGTWSIASGEALSAATPTNAVATYRPVQLGSSYNVSAHIRIVSSSPSGAEWSGIAANVQGTTSLNYYVLRVTTAGGARTGQWQLLKMAASTTPTVLAQGNMNAPYGTSLELNLGRTGTRFTVSVRNSDSGATLVDTSYTLPTTDPTRVGGSAGLYSNTGNLRAKSFSLTTSTPAISPPATRSDDFERANGSLGADWVSDRGTWSIASGEALSAATPTNAVATYRPVQLGSSYNVSAHIRIVSSSPSGAEWSGIAANVQGTTSLNYYVLRVTTAGGARTGQWQLLKMAASTTPTVLAQGNMNAPYGTSLELNLGRTGTRFTVSVRNSDSGATLVDTSYTLPTTDPTRVGGSAGLYSNTGNLRAKSFSLTTSTPAISPPGTLDCTVDKGSYDFPDAQQQVLQTIPVDTTWAGMPVTQRVLTHDDDQYVAYYDDARRMTVAHRSLSDDSWTTKVLPSTLGWDSHNYVSLGLDRDGNLHVSGNMHNVALVYFRTTVPGDVTSLTRVTTMIDASTENSVTYPEFINRQDGSLVFSHRNGGSGDGVTYFNVYDEASSAWSRLVDEPLFDGEGSDDNPSGTWNAYFENPALGPDGWFHMVWVWRDTGDAATNSQLSYAKSRNLVDWFDSAGHALTTPFRYGEADVIDPVPNGGGLLNGNSKLGFDAEGTPIISYHKYDDDGNSQIYVARPDGSGAWDIHQISDWKGRWSFGGGGSIVFTLSMLGSEVMEDGNIRVDFTCSGEPRSIVIDGGLYPVAEASTPELPGEITDVRGTYPGLAVRLQADLADRNDTGTYYLRWESLPHNQDKPRTDWPREGSALEVVLLGPPSAG
ncbi:BNR repeat-containing protein [Streptomyces europaeiscabiei]|uniref:BNR repeat-containing protein n=1 Tax=Streptomyces europaeiscabiei TaxID=146819 RepID=UPI0038F622C6